MWEAVVNYCLAAVIRALLLSPVYCLSSVLFTMIYDKSDWNKTQDKRREIRDCIIVSFLYSDS